jgi:hypothetical protein
MSSFDEKRTSLALTSEEGSLALTAEERSLGITAIEVYKCINVAQ